MAQRNRQRTNRTRRYRGGGLWEWLKEKFTGKTATPVAGNGVAVATTAPTAPVSSTTAPATIPNSAKPGNTTPMAGGKRKSRKASRKHCKTSRKASRKAHRKAHRKHTRKH